MAGKTTRATHYEMTRAGRTFVILKLAEGWSWFEDGKSIVHRGYATKSEIVAELEQLTRRQLRRKAARVADLRSIAN